MNDLCFIYAACLLFSLLMGALILPRIANISHRKRLMDVPDEGRRVHQAPVPRLGGISFLPIALMSLFLFNSLCVLLLDAQVQAADTSTFLQMQLGAMGCLLLFLIGAADDLVGVSYRVKFVAQFAAAALLPLSGLCLNNLGGLLPGVDVLPGWASAVLTVFLVVYVTNGINLIDGVDGLASGISILALVLYVALFVLLGRPVFVGVGLSLLGVLLVFFCFNVFGGLSSTGHKLFMGDTGSLTLGYFLSFLLLQLSAMEVHTQVFAGSLFYVALGPLVIPLLDIVRVVMARYHDRVPLFKADKRHIHHKLLRAGLGPRGTMLTLLLLTVYFSGLNLLLARCTTALWIVGADVVSWMVMHGVINHAIRRTMAQRTDLEERFGNVKNTIPEKNKFML